MKLKGLDATDVDILNLIQANANLKYHEIASNISLPTSTVQTRLQRLMKSGLIKKFATLLDGKKLGYKLVVFTMIKLDHHGPDTTAELQARIKSFDEVMECYSMSGRKDLLLKVAVKDMDAYQNFVFEKLNRLPNIGIIESSFVLNTYKEETSFNLTPSASYPI